MPAQVSSQQIYDKINKLINSSRYNEAFLLLKRNMSNFMTLQNDLEKLKTSESTYKYMLDFIAEGNNDPSRDEMMEKIRSALLHANDILWREMKLTDSSDLYSSTRRLEQLRKTTIYQYLDNFRQTLEEDRKTIDGENKTIISPAQTRTLDELFNYVWTMSGVEDNEYDALSAALNDETLPDYVKSLLISAIILANLSYFDPMSFDILLNQFDSSDVPMVKARAIVGITLIALLHYERIASNIDLRSRLLISIEDDGFKKLVNEVLIKIIRTYDTTRIDKKMRNEVIPELMKMNPEIMDKLRNMASDSENFLSDTNPDWEEFLENSGISSKLQEINDMQLEGADVLVTAFSNLKNFPFFNSISRWFLPYIPGYYEFNSLELNNNPEMFERMSAVMCDSDINSFLLSLKSMPQDNRNKVVASMKAQMKEVKEAMANPIGETDFNSLSLKINHTLQDLYRFFKFFRKKEDFTDPFSKPVVNSNIEPLISLMGFDKENIRLIAEFYFKNKYYDEAASMLQLADSLQPGEFVLWEKIGYSHDRMQRFDKATEWYLKAELLNPQSQWLQKKLAIALKNAGRPAEALIHYEKALANEPENFHLIMSAAQCLLDIDKPQEALNHFYHAQYLNPEKLSPQRAIAWASLLTGDFDKAISSYQKILMNEKSDKTDILNAAHAYLAKGDFKSALSFYKSFLDKTDNKDITNLVLAFRDDSAALKRIGVKTLDLRLIIDKLRYDISPLNN